MKWFDLIFSDQPYKRYQRHVIFWIGWLLYFAGSFLSIQHGLKNGGSTNLILVILAKSFLLLPGHALFVYSFIYFLLPLFMLKSRYFYLVLSLIFLSAIIIAWSYYCYAILFPSLDSMFGVSTVITKNILLWSSISAGLISSFKVVAAAAAIKLLKRWYLKQKENDRLEKEKISVELQLLKTQIRPDVLLNSLDNIYLLAKNDTAKASELLLTLSDLLSYILYECDDTQVLLEKEVNMLKNYIAIEKIRMGDRLEISMVVKGDITGKMIAPLLLLPFVERSLLYCGKDTLEKKWVNLDIRIEGNDLFMKVINGKSVDDKVLVTTGDDYLNNVFQRIQLLYPERNEIRINAEAEIMSTFLKIQLAPLAEERYIIKDELELPSQTTAYATE